VISPIPRLLTWSRRRRLRVAAGLLILLACSGLGVSRLAFDTDVLSLLPRDGAVVPAFRTFVEHFGSLDELYVVFTAPEGHAIADYEAEIQTWVERLRATPEIVSIDTGLADRARNLGWLADRQLLLLGEDALPVALSRLRGETMRPALRSRAELLALPSPAVADMVRQDPLGLYDLLRQQLGGAQAGVNLGVTEGGYVTPDSRARLVIAHPARPPYDTDFSRALAARLEGIRQSVAPSHPAADGPAAGDEPLPPLSVEFAGGHRIAVETEGVVRRESIVNTVGSLALILPLLFLVFRSVWLVIVGPLPAGASLVIVLGLLGLGGTTLSAAATASAAMLFGLGVDGVVLLYVAHTLVVRQGADPDTAVERLHGPAASMLLGMWTTAATFYGLTLVDFPSLQQLGALVGHSMVLCGVLTLLIVPALLPRRGASGRTRSLAMPALAGWIVRRRTIVLAAAALITVALGVAATRVRIDPTLDRLRSVTPGAAVLDRLGRQFGLPADVYVILQRGPNLDDLLASNERLSGDITASLPFVRLQPASALLPSDMAQSAREDAIRRAGLTTADVAARLSDAATAEGFREDAFAPFRNRLPRLLERGHRLTYDGYVASGLGDLIGRFVARTPTDWLLVSYVFPSNDAELRRLEQVVETTSGTTLTGLPLVNRELARRFLPQFLKGLSIGSVVVIVLILGALRDWRLSLLSLAPAAIGLIWAAGVLAIARVELDLFAVFAVVTFVGIGVDYGVHLVHRYRERGHARQAIEELAPVILVAAAITLLGYGTLVTSTYPPLRSIGIVSAVAVVTLAAASVIVLPALLSTVAAREARSHTKP
jgi:predicted RND superfamily exporter protein